MKTFQDLKFTDRTDGPISMGISARMFFPNDYGVSVIKGPFSYGGPDGLYELGVLKGNELNWSLTYDTPVTEDVEGFLTEDQVTELMKKVQAL